MYYKRKYSPKKKTPANSNAMAVAKKALKLAKKVDVRAERKFFYDDYATALPASGSWATYPLLEIPQGDSADTRDGNAVFINEITLRIALDSSAGTNITPGTVRFVVCQDLQQDPGNALTPAEVFHTAADWNSVYNFPISVNRFRVLRDFCVDITPETLTSATGWITSAFYSVAKLKTMTLKIKLPYKKVQWYGASGSDYQKNHVYLFMQKSNSGYTVTPYIDAMTEFIDS